MKYYDTLRNDEINAYKTISERSNLLSPTEKKKSPVKKLVIALVIILTLLVFLGSLAGLGVLIGYLVINHKYPYHGDALHWDWSKINVNDLEFSKDFMWGVASAAHQIEGNCTNNQWFMFERQVNPKTGKTPIVDGSVSGKAADFWNLYSEDIDRMKDIGLNTFRFSIEWSKVEPSPNVFDADAVKHYHDVIDKLHSSGIEPIVTMFHFTQPIWFADLGGWTNHSNLPHFYRFAEYIYKEYNQKVKYWVTVNAPNAYALQGWDQGVWAPGQQYNMPAAADVMANLAEAHVAVYQLIKALPEGNSSRVGFVLNMQQFDPANATNALDRMTSGLVEAVYSGGFLSYFSTGKFTLVEPGVVTKMYENPLAPSSIDFIGMNYYGNAYVKFALNKEKYELVPSPYDIITDIGWPIYPEGIYRALMTLTQKLPNLPILISENGIADEKDRYRDMFIKRYLYATSKAMKEGAKVIGYCHWALTDNFQWEFGFTMRFGLYSVDYATQTRTLRNGAKALMSIIKRFSTNRPTSGEIDQVVTWTD